MKALLGICGIGFIVIAVFTLSKKDQDITDLDEGVNQEVQVEKTAAPEPKAEETKEVASKEPEQPKVADAPPPPPASGRTRRPPTGASGTPGGGSGSLRPQSVR